MKSEGEYGTNGNNGTDRIADISAIPSVPLFPVVPYSLLISDLKFRTAGLAFDFKSRARTRSLELDSQDGAGLESDVVAFGDEQADQASRAAAARPTTKPASRSGDDRST